MTVTAFHKVEGLGNDFLLIEGGHDALARLRRDAPGLCNRRRGIGADGILLVGPGSGPDADATMWVVNHDGSRPEMCGNGLRCVALWVAAKRGLSRVLVDTDAGPKACRVTPGPRGPATAGLSAEVEVDMGPTTLGGHQTPEGGEGRRFASVGIGNPHAITFVSEADDPEALARRLGPAIAVDALYPQGTNVEFAAVKADGSIVLWVWERGCGITDACGTGACATVAAAVAADLVRSEVPVAVALPGGVLMITVPSGQGRESGRGVSMRGPARVVFSGTVPV
ncbi:MAG: diaminopimelate epimerase [Nannocystaceae bacterium]|nr:diaminopimelate epimerase [Nannocystaceae bacterium]